MESQVPDVQCAGLQSRGLGSGPGQVIVLCSWAKHFPLTVSLSSQEYKWELVDFLGKPDEMLGGETL